ncbi:MAG: hypothetical protein NC293_05780 [Roseburia sp.]|nr:hypothetical protein [Roseburia sp.]
MSEDELEQSKNIMSKDIILDDWALPSAIGVCRKSQREYNIDKEELDRDIQQNREIVKRIRNNKRYAKILQEV